MTPRLKAHTHQRPRVPTGGVTFPDASIAQRWDEMTHKECQDVCGLARVPLTLAGQSFNQIASNHQEKIERVMKEKV